MGFPCGSVIKNLSANVRDTGLTPGSGRVPGEGNYNPAWEILWTDEPGGLYSPQDCKRVRHDLATKQHNFTYAKY